MLVLYLTKVFPFGAERAGDAVYSAGLVKAFGQFAKVTVLTYGDRNSDDDFHGVDSEISWKFVSQNTSHRWMSLLSSEPLISYRHKSNDFLREFKGLLEVDWDVIVFDNLAMIFAFRYYLSRTVNKKAVTLYVAHEAEHHIRREKYNAYRLSFLGAFAAKWDLVKIKTAERYLAHNADVTTLINSADLSLIDGLPEEKSLVISPGYHDEIKPYWPLNETDRTVVVLGGRTSEQKKLILREWLLVSYPLFEKAHIRTIIIGAIDKDLQEFINKTYPNVRIEGFVEDPYPYLKSARLGVIPDTLGGGFKLRLLTHVFSHVPIFGLHKAIIGLPTSNKVGFSGSETLEELAKEIVARIDDLEYLEGLRRTALS